jgi:hypothetical protein
MTWTQQQTEKLLREEKREIVSDCALQILTSKQCQKNKLADSEKERYQE